MNGENLGTVKSTSPRSGLYMSLRAAADKGSEPLAARRSSNGRPAARIRMIAGMPPGLDVAAVRHYCEQHVPPHAIHQVRTELDISRGALTIMECRAPWHPDMGPKWTRRGVARLRYTIKSGLWTLYWKDRNDRWHRYDLIEPSAKILALLDEIDRDPTGIFWG